MTIRVTKAEKEIMKQVMAAVILDGRCEITNQTEHRIAEILVKMGEAVVSKKKNYGRIAEIRRAS